MAVATSDRFGFLPIKRVIEFDGGRLDPLHDYDESLTEVEAHIHADGVVFPPLVWNQSVFPARRDTASNLRPALLYRLPASHSLTVTAPFQTSNFRQQDGGFLIHFVGHMFSYRLQFHDWWHDGIVPMLGRRWSVLPERRESSLLSTAYQSWKTWPEAERVRFTNLLYTHVRSFSYEWDWERFAIRYMIFDGCYRTAVALGEVTGVRGCTETAWKPCCRPVDSQPTRDGSKRLSTYETTSSMRCCGTGVLPALVPAPVSRTLTIFGASTTAYFLLSLDIAGLMSQPHGGTSELR